jgi:hypothetical protein
VADIVGRAVRGAGGGVDAAVGLCGVCDHARPVVSGRGSTFWLCGLSATDARFAKYPRLPVVRCAGFVRHEGPGHPDDERSAPA